jgi:SAM-dependent methyltransferase
MKPATWQILRRLYRGETLTRIFMNHRLSRETLRGKVADVGGGHSPNYFEYLQREDGTEIPSVDASMSGIDFEKDRLPHQDAQVDTVVLCNVLEHIYNYRHLASEVRRICAPSGQVLGFVPFWVGYHPDPRDYFRYTRESLALIFKEAGFSRVSIEALGGSPLLANFNTIVLTLPGWLRPVLYLWYRPLDALFLYLRPHSAVRNPLGYFFKLQP